MKINKNTFILTGSNIDDRQFYLQAAQNDIANAGVRIYKTSIVYETAAWGSTNQAPYLNQVLQVGTCLSPSDLLILLLEIERKHGRQRTVRWGSRTLDLDILYYDQLVVCLRDLTIPHPRMAQRRFVLEPLASIAPYFVHPVSRLSQQQLLKQCPDPLFVTPFAG